MQLQYLNFLAEADGDQAFTRGERINWEQFQINLAAHAAATNNSTQRLDAIMWLGIAGHPQATTMARPVEINMSPAWMPGPEGIEGAFMEGYGIAVNRDLYPDLNANNEDIAEVLTHELRHRGFRIIGDIPILLQRIPAEYQNAIRSNNSGVSLNDPEHSMIYAMDGLSVDNDRVEDDPDASDVRYWQREYAKVNQAVREWLDDQPIPRGAPEALRQDLERIYGQTVEFVEPEETPVTPPEAVEDEEAIVIIVPPRIADQAEKPDLSSIRTTRDNTLARQAGESPEGKRGVELLQQALNYLGADPELSVDGKYGPATRNAVRDFQQEHNLQVDGLAGPETMGKIRELLGQSRNPDRQRPNTGATAPGDVGDGTRGNSPADTGQVVPTDIDMPTQNIELTSGPNSIQSFLPWKDELEAAGYTVAPSGRAVRGKDWGTVAGIGANGTVWFGDRVVRNIVKGHGTSGDVADTRIGRRPEDNIYIDR